jgi:hypothetical protein
VDSGYVARGTTVLAIVAVLPGKTVVLGVLSPSSTVCSGNAVLSGGNVDGYACGDGGMTVLAIVIVIPGHTVVLGVLSPSSTVCSGKAVLSGGNVDACACGNGGPSIVAKATDSESPLD